MYSLLITNELKRVLERELVPFAVALFIAQLFFKWGSFALELAGFLVVWFLLGYIAEKASRFLKR